jgi:hypothetical protein
MKKEKVVNWKKNLVEKRVVVMKLYKKKKM